MQALKHIALFPVNLNCGGIERNTVRLANAFIEKGYAVDIVCLSPGDDLQSMLDKRVRVYYLNVPRGLLAPFYIAHHLKKQRYDALLPAGDFVNVATVMAGKIAGLNIPIYVSVHRNASCSDWLYKGMRKWKWAITLKLAKFFYPLAAKCICVSEGVKQDVIKLHGLSLNKIQVIYNPIVEDKDRGRIYEKPVHPWFLEDVPVVIGCGRLCLEKHFLLLIEAIALVLKQQKVRLMILGEGGERGVIEACIREKGLGDVVWLEGQVAEPKAYMQHAALLALSSLQEGFGNVIVEAMQVGTPVVSVDCLSGPREILDRGKYGMLVENYNPEALAEAIIAMLRAPFPDAATLKRRADDFRVSVIAEQYLKVMGF